MDNINIEALRAKLLSLDDSALSGAITAASEALGLDPAQAGLLSRNLGLVRSKIKGAGTDEIEGVLGELEKSDAATLLRNLGDSNG